MNGTRKFVLAIALAAGTATLFSGCGNGDAKGAARGEPVVIRVVHAAREMDPLWRDPVTGEPYMGQQERDARLYAERKALEKFNVRFSWVDSEGRMNPEMILRSVLAGDPLGELIKLAAQNQGPVLGQNSLQPLDDFADAFDDEDSGWMLLGKVYGHRFFLDDEMRTGGYAPLVYNIGMLKEIPALRENGRTILPAELFVEGRWTWSVFEDYLQKIRDYYAATGKDVIPYSSSYQFPALQAIHSNGGSVYGDAGLDMDGRKTRDAVAYIERLVERNLLGNTNIDSVSGRTGWGMDEFLGREVVFNNLMQWWAFNIGSHFSDRGDAIGVVPFPRPDGMAIDDPDYGQLNEAYDCYAVPRGISREKAELAVRAFKEYTVAYYKRMANSDRALDFMQTDASAVLSAVNLQLDVTNEEYGDKVLAAWKYLASKPHKNEFAANAGLWDFWSVDILGASLNRVPGAFRYAVQVGVKMPVVTEIMDGIRGAISGTEVVGDVAS